MNGSILCNAVRVSNKPSFPENWSILPNLHSFAMPLQRPCFSRKRASGKPTAANHPPNRPTPLSQLVLLQQFQCTK